MRAVWDEAWATVRSLLSRPSVQLGYAVSAIVLVAATMVLARRAGWTRNRQAVGMAAALSLALFPALTLARRGVDLKRHPGCQLVWRGGVEPASAEQLLNLLLLVPAGFFCAWALRRAWPVAVGALVLSVGAESTQAVLGIGLCQTTDVLRNVVGAVVAACFGSMLGRVLAGRTGGEPLRRAG